MFDKSILDKAKIKINIDVDYQFFKITDPLGDKIFSYRCFDIVGGNPVVHIFACANRYWRYIGCDGRNNKFNIENITLESCPFLSFNKFEAVEYQNSYTHLDKLYRQYIIEQILID